MIDVVLMLCHEFLNWLFCINYALSMVISLACEFDCLCVIYSRVFVMLGRVIVQTRMWFKYFRQYRHLGTTFYVICRVMLKARPLFRSCLYICNIFFVQINLLSRPVELDPQQNILWWICLAFFVDFASKNFTWFWSVYYLRFLFLHFEFFIVPTCI